MKSRSICAVLCAAVLCVAGLASAETPYAPAWVQQLGTSYADWGYSVAADTSGNVYIAGLTYGDIGGTNAGLNDVYLTKYNSTGTVQWSQILGTASGDYGFSVAVDNTGYAYVSGFTSGNISGTNAGGMDAFLAKYSTSSGTQQWARQLGSTGSDYGYSVAVDGSGNSYLAGYTNGVIGASNAGGYDAFLTKYNAAGTLQWSQQIGTSLGDQAFSVDVDSSGNAYIAGQTYGNLGGNTNAGLSDAFLVKYDTSGAIQWSRLVGTDGYDEGFSVAVDGSGNAYLAGQTDSDLGGTNAGGYDAFVAKFNTTGTLQWTRQVGTADSDFAHSAAVDSAGHVYIAGGTDGSLGGTSNGDLDAFVTKLDSAGNVMWSQQAGSDQAEQSVSVAVDGSGNVFLSGTTYGDMQGTNAGDSDAFLIKYAAAGILGDFNGNELLDAGDIDLINAAIRGGSTDLTYDLDSNGLVTLADKDVLVLDIIGTQYGDANFDYIVGLSDGSILLSRWQQSATSWSQGDFNGDGVISLSDGSMLLSHWQWQRTAGDSAAITMENVPEPATMALLAIGGLTLLRRRKTA